MRYFNKRDITRFLQATDNKQGAIEYFKKHISARLLKRCIK
jgi:hypothetical protein